MEIRNASGEGVFKSNINKMGETLVKKLTMHHIRNLFTITYKVLTWDVRKSKEYGYLAKFRWLLIDGFSGLICKVLPHHVKLLRMIEKTCNQAWDLFFICILRLGYLLPHHVKLLRMIEKTCNQAWDLFFICILRLGYRRIKIWTLW